jgi:hypothetical protein
MTQITSTPGSGTKSRVGPWAWIFGIVIIAALALVMLWPLFGNSPQVTLDEGTATYSGPTEFDVGMVTFDFGFEEADNIAFALWGLTDDSMTLSQLEARSSEIEYPNIPEWVNPRAIKYMSTGGEWEIFLTEGTWSLWAVSDPDGANVAEPLELFDVS